ncbi:MAG: hypothetical protein MUC80_08515 [Candidatus Thermoplasmatota archaeon]|jgi:hypothetical protein|nr:hypothetical protein [Candidatus Thermoplasmatota archaeon]
MKKILALGLSLFFFGMTLAVVTPGFSQNILQPIPLDPTGTFQANIGYKRQGENATVVGTMNGTYEMRARGGRFIGDWYTENKTGTLRGGFGRHFLIGRITILVNETERTLPVVGFLRAQDGEFIGRFMAPVGPALYFWGTYT